MSGNLQVEECDNISQQELANLVQSMKRRCTGILNAAGGCYFDFDPPFVQGHIVPFLLITCLWNLFSLSQLLNLMLIQIFTHVTFAENKQLTVRGHFIFL